MTTRNFLKNGILAAGALLSSTVQANTINPKEWKYLSGRLSYNNGGSYGFDTYHFVDANRCFKSFVKETVNLPRLQKQRGGVLKYYIRKTRDGVKREISYQQAKELFGI